MTHSVTQFMNEAMHDGVFIDYSRDDLLTQPAKAILKDRYMLPEETSPQEAFARAAVAFSDDLAHSIVTGKHISVF